MVITPDSSSVFASSHSGWGGWTLSKDLTIKVFLSLREGTSRLSGSVIKSSPKFR
jgi:hypothetical protein